MALKVYLFVSRDKLQWAKSWKQNGRKSVAIDNFVESALASLLLTDICFRDILSNQRRKIVALDLS